MKLSAKNAGPETLKAVKSRLHEIERTARRDEGVNWEQLILYMLLSESTQNVAETESAEEFNTALKAVGEEYPDLIVA